MLDLFVNSFLGSGAGSILALKSPPKIQHTFTRALESGIYLLLQLSTLVVGLKDSDTFRAQAVNGPCHDSYLVDQQACDQS